MFEVLQRFALAAAHFAPHNILNSLINGGARSPIYDEAAFMEYSGYNPRISFNEIEQGVTFSDIKMPEHYVAQMDARDKAEFTIYNKTDHPKRFYVEFYQDWCEVVDYQGGRARCEYGGAHPQAAPPRVVLIPSNGAQEIEFWYSTPPAPRHDPEYGDVLYMRIVIQITDEKGKKAKMTKRTKAVVPGP